MECPTCYCDLNINNIVNAQCGHSFCKDCFWKWVNDHKKNDCPMCRADIINNNRFKQEKVHSENQFTRIFEFDNN